MKLLSLLLLLSIFAPLYLYSQSDKQEQAHFDNSERSVFVETLRLALEAKKLGKAKMADSIANVYKICYLDTLNDTLLLTNSTFEFVLSFREVINSNDRFFKYFYKCLLTDDKIILGGRDYFRDLVKYIINKEEINARLFNNGHIVNKSPRWKNIYANISKKYTKKYADELIPIAKISFYRRLENWKDFAKVIDDRITDSHPTQTSNILGGGFGDSWTINGIAWDVFLHCNNKKVLKRALNWSNISIALCKEEVDAIQYFDTKANLLYKLGRQSLAIQIEEKAVNLSNGFHGYKVVLSKMREGIPTWPSK